MPPLITLGGTFLLWITAKGRLQAYTQLATTKASASPGASSSPVTVTSPTVAGGSPFGTDASWLGAAIGG